MAFGKSFRCMTAALALTAAAAASAFAQEEISDEHRAAAREAIRALGATDQFDQILPRAAAQLKSTLIQATPNYEDAIDVTVDEVALALAGRRADLEREAALIYARNFTEEELEAISEFYNSEAGQKLLDRGADVTRELLRSAEIWANGISRDLATETDTALEARLGANTPGSAGAGAPGPDASSAGTDGAAQQEETPAQ